MHLSKWIVVAGFMVGGAGFLIGVLLDNRPLGIQVFVAGFLLAVIGMIISFLQLRVSDKFLRTTRGMQVGAIGIGIASLSFVVDMFFTKIGVIATSLFVIGTAVVGLGIVLVINGVLRDRIDLGK